MHAGTGMSIDALEAAAALVGRGALPPPNHPSPLSHQPPTVQRTV